MPTRNITFHIHLSVPSFINHIGKVFKLGVLVFALYLLSDTFGLNYLFVDRANAAIPNSARIIPYQGILTNSSGNYVADGNYSIVFAIYNVASAGTALWSETQTVAVTNGVFTVNIGSTDVNGVNLAMDTPPYYLGVKIGTNAEMTPRILLAFSPFSFVAKNVDVAPPGVPTAGVMFFNLAACPTGWTEVTAARGRVMVGLPLSGTLAGTVGTGLTNLEDRTHNHGLPLLDVGFNASNLSEDQSDGQIIAIDNLISAIRINRFDEGGGYWLAQFNKASDTYTGDSGFKELSTYGGSTNNANTSNVIPYIQLLACQKS